MTACTVSISTRAAGSAEVVSRMQHRGTARTRSVRIRWKISPEAGTTILAGDKPVGTMGSTAGVTASH